MDTPDAGPARPRRRAWPWVLAATGLAVIAAGGYGVRLWDRARTALADAGRVGELHAKLAVRAQPLTDDEFEEALSLCGTADPEARFVALLTATAHAQRHRPDLKVRVIPVAERLTGDPEPDVRQRAAKALASLTK